MKCNQNMGWVSQGERATNNYCGMWQPWALQKQRWVKQLLQIKGSCHSAPLTAMFSREEDLKHKLCLPVLAKLLEFPGEINPFSQHEVSKVKHVIIKAENLFFFAKMALKYLQEVKRTQRSASTCFRSQDPLVHEPEALPAGSCSFPITSYLAPVHHPFLVPCFLDDSLG